MKLPVLGASQGAAALCVKAVLAEGYTVTAFASTPAILVPAMRRRSDEGACALRGMTRSNPINRARVGRA